jgi:hypothetical protein
MRFEIPAPQGRRSEGKSEAQGAVITRQLTQVPAVAGSHDRFKTIPAPQAIETHPNCRVDGSSVAPRPAVAGSHDIESKRTYYRQVGLAQLVMKSITNPRRER